MLPVADPQLICSSHDRREIMHVGGYVMKQFLKRIFYYPWRFCYRLVCWINYPTPRERMWHMYALGKAQGRKEALKEVPIARVQPRQTTQPGELHIPPGEWTRQWRATHSELIRKPITTVLPVITEDAYDESWLNAKPPVQLSLDAQTTEKMPAVVKLLHERKQHA
jgi:hypothetical protein